MRCSAALDMLGVASAPASGDRESNMCRRLGFTEFCQLFNIPLEYCYRHLSSAENDEDVAGMLTRQERKFSSGRVWSYPSSKKWSSA
mmetsp:Transcript_46107/g.86003  ORF Transcript_46107/g.86003 Transcript_46107/m.86003 type:complete len:87 (+) Transcript_46107:27-287(+)